MGVRKLLESVSGFIGIHTAGIVYLWGRKPQSGRIRSLVGLFGDKTSVARRRYLEFLKKRIAAGKRQDLTGGGLVRSVGGWSAVKSLRKAGVFEKGDERILGTWEFVEKALSQAEEAF